MYEICRFCDKEDETVTEFIEDYRDQLEILTQLEIQLGEDLPSRICDECVQDLLRAIAFRERCRTSEEKLGVERRFLTSNPARPRSRSPESMYLMNLGQSLKSEPKPVREITSQQPKRKPTVMHVHQEIPKKKIKIEKPDFQYEVQTKIEEDFGEYVLPEGNDAGEEFVGYEVLDEAFNIPLPRPKLPKEGPFVCEPCGVSYNNKRSFSTHWHFKHRHANRRYVCPECGKIYNKSDQFKGHLNTHLAVLPFACDICGSRFARKGAIVKHMMVHSGLKPITCPYCPKKFGFTIDLKRHLTSHTGIYIYSCQFCGKGFNRKKPFMDHEASH